MVNRKSDLALTGFFIKDYLSPEVEFSAGIYQDELCLISKKASRIPQYILPLICFELHLWIILLATTIFCTIIWAIIRHFNYRIIHRQDIEGREFREIFVDTFILTISAPLRKLPEIASERSFAATICLLSLVFVSLFQSSLSVVFIKPLFYKDIMTFDDIADTQLPIYVKYLAMMDDMFPQDSEGVLEQLKNQMRHITTTSSVLAQLSQAGNFITVTRRCTVYQDNAYYFSSRLLHLIPQCPRIYNLAYLAPRNSIYIRRVNEILLQLNNGGFHEKWIRDLNYKYSWQTRMKYGSFYEDDFKVLTVTDLQLPFFILAIGFGVAALVFVGEWMWRIKEKCQGRH